MSKKKRIRLGFWLLGVWHLSILAHTWWNSSFNELSLKCSCHPCLLMRLDIKRCLVYPLKNKFQFLNNITRIFTHFFTYAYFHTCFQTLPKRMGHAKGRRKIGWRKHKDIQPSEEKNWIHNFCLISCTKVKACVLAFIVTWCEECGRKKRRKMCEIEGKAIRPWVSSLYMTKFIFFKISIANNTPIHLIPVMKFLT